LTAPTLTYSHGFLTDCDSVDTSTTGTADNGTAITTVDAERTEATTDYWKGYYIHFTGGPNIGLARLITAFTPATDTLTHDAFPVAVGAGHTYFLTDWGEFRTNMVDADATLSVADNDILQIEAIFDGGAAVDENVYYEKDITDVAVADYPKYLVRWKTSGGSAAAQAKIQLVGDGGGPNIQTISLGYSTTWKESRGDVTVTDTNIDKIRFYADDELNETPNGTYYVYYEFLLLHVGTFTIPQWDTCELIMENRDADVEIPGRVGDIDQYLGMKSPYIHMDGPMDTNTAWGTPDGEYMYKIHLRRFTEPWQWLTCDMGNFKVTSRILKIGQYKDSGYQRMWTWDLKLYSKSSGDATLWGSDLEWLGLT